MRRFVSYAHVNGGLVAPLVGVSNGPILFSSARIARKNYISARLLGF